MRILSFCFHQVTRFEESRKERLENEKSKSRIEN